MYAYQHREIGDRQLSRPLTGSLSDVLAATVITHGPQYRRRNQPDRSRPRIGALPRVGNAGTAAAPRGVERRHDGHRRRIAPVSESLPEIGAGPRRLRTRREHRCNTARVAPQCNWNWN